ncbi:MULTISPECIES: extracellular solute-binding protein [unclassified Pseudofrankia]|uniref:extracellular solute-binding protein n=1 Tax=unclassified Pseudofrankia TaxID=2994372 RepID=UPI0008D94DF6|nr:MULTISPECIES: extracellular solute-binding protein [unclassified Pseudofrankia]MDT3445400.1 extracellular solute-binding protein [Pseudofrankia sp. BMG5.37]OHV61264.1 hypothetical protein BCD48_40095 [Pseudofrankia sp. BMG5.36]
MSEPEPNNSPAPDDHGAAQARPDDADPSAGGGRGWPSRRTVLRAAAATVVIGVAGGVALSRAFRDDGGAIGDPDSRRVRWAASSNDQNLVDSRQVLISAFQKAHPEITVELRLVPFSTDAKRQALIELVRSGTGEPDVYLGDVIWPAEFAVDQLAMPLDDEFEPAFWDRFDPAALAASRYRGRIYAVPYFANRGVLYYRPDLLGQVGRPPPTTWEELAETARMLRDVAHAEYRIAWQGDAYEGLTCVWTEFAASAGGSTVDPGVTRSTIDSPPCARALRFMCGLVEQGLTHPDLTTLREPLATSLFNDGEAAFMRGWNTADTALDTEPEKYRATQLPAFAGQRAPGFSAIGGWSMFVNPHTHRLAAVRTFVDWMTSVPAQRTLSRYSQMPANRSVLEDLSLVNESPMISVTRGVRSVARPAGTPRYPEISRAVYTNINLALRGQATPADALARAHRDITLSLRG